MIVYRVVSNGVDIEFTENKRSAEAAYKDAKCATLYEVDGRAVNVLAHKTTHSFKFQDLAKYGH